MYKTGPKPDPKILSDVIMLAKMGYGPSSTAKMLGVSHGRVRNYLVYAGLPSKRSKVIEQETVDIRLENQLKKPFAEIIDEYRHLGIQEFCIRFRACRKSVGRAVRKHDLKPFNRVRHKRDHHHHNAGRDD